MTTDILQPVKLDIGRVITQTFGVIGRNFLVFFVLSLLLSGIPTAIIGYVQGQLVSQVAANPTFAAALIVPTVFGVIAAIITMSILQAALIHGAVQDLNGSRPQIGECLATGLRRFLPLFVVSLLFSLAMFGGTLLLIVPGIMIACAWCVAVPALVADGTTIGGAFGRSAELTRGNRWRIFGLFLVILLILLVIGMIAGLVGLAAAAPLMSAEANAQQFANSPVMSVINTITNTLSSMLGSAGVAVLYVELRKAREGVGPEWLSKVFE